MYIFIHIFTNIYICTYTYLFMHICIHVYVFTKIFGHTIYMCVYVYIYLFIHICINISQGIYHKAYISVEYIFVYICIFECMQVSEWIRIPRSCQDIHCFECSYFCAYRCMYAGYLINLNLCVLIKKNISNYLNSSRQLSGSKQRGVKEWRLIDIQNVDSGNTEECMWMTSLCICVFGFAHVYVRVCVYIFVCVYACICFFLYICAWEKTHLTVCRVRVREFWIPVQMCTF